MATGKAVSVLDDPAFLALPEDLESFFKEEANVLPKETVPSLSYEGKTWTISLNGEKTQLKGKNAEGDEVPVSVMRVVILGYAKRRGRAFYEGAYDPKKPGRPVCWSDDGVVPAEAVKEKQAAKCESCPMAVKGSKVTEANKATTACSQHRMLALVPANRLDFEPLRMKIAITSDYDGQSPDHEAAGWYAFNNLTQLLEKRNIPHTALFVTKMKFDPNATHPKVLFAADRRLTPDELRKILPYCKKGTPEHDKIEGLISGRFSPDGVDGTAVEKPAPAQVAATQAKPAASATPTKTAAQIAAEKKAKEEAEAKALKLKKAAEAKAAYEKAMREAEGEEVLEEEITDQGGAVEEEAVEEVVEEEVVEEVIPEVKPKPTATARAAGKPATASAKPPATGKSKANGKAPEPAPLTGEVLPPGSDDGLGDLLAEWGPQA